MKVRVYNSGRISGLTKEFAKANFDRADMEIEESLSIQLRKELKAVNPMKSIIPRWMSWWIHMAADIALLLTCSGVYFQSNFKYSRGALIEHKIAKALGKNLYYEYIDYSQIK